MQNQTVCKITTILYAVKVKRHNVCKRHGFLDTGFKQTERTIFVLCYFNEKKLGAHFERSCRKIERKFRRKMPGYFAVECQHHSMQNPCQIFRFQTLDSQL